VEVTAEAVEAALGAAARDSRLELDDPEKLAERLLLAAMFPNHPYQHPPGFVAESFKDLQPIDVQEFLDRWFVPGNATLFIVGDVSTVQAIELARERLETLPWRQPPRRREITAPASETIRISTAAPARAGLDITWLTWPMGYYENAAVDVLMHHLCNPVDGPLCERLLRLGCPLPRWHREAWRHGGLLLLSIDLPPEDREGQAPAVPTSRGATSSLPTRAFPTPADLEQIVTEELAKAAESIPTEIEHNRARALAMRDVRNACAAFGDRALALATNEIIAGDLLIADLALPRLERVAEADVQQAAIALQETRTVVATVRKQTAESMPRGGPANDGREPLPPPPSEHPAPTADVATRELSSGVRITFRRARQQELAEVRTLLHTDARLDRAVRILMAVGSERLPIDRFRDYLSYHGLDLFPVVESSHAGLRSRGPASYVAQMTELQADLIRHPNRSEAACRAGAARIRDFLQNRVGRTACNESETYVPPGLIGWVPAMTGLQTADWNDALRQLGLVQSIEVIIVADAEPERVFEAVESVWADWSPSGATEP